MNSQPKVVAPLTKPHDKWVKNDKTKKVLAVSANPDDEEE